MTLWSILRLFGNILWPFDIFCGHLVYFPRFGILYQEKSGNPALYRKSQLKTCSEIRRIYFSDKHSLEV
jgi:hypothetical protein